MNLAIVYSTNSGGTFLSAEIIKNKLEKKHKVILKKAEEMSAKKLIEFDAVIFGTPSWFVEGKESMPQEYMLGLLKNMQETHFAPKKFAAFGTGNSSFTVFCGAVDYIEKTLQSLRAEMLVPSLKIDGYYFREEENNKKIQEWADDLSKALK